ncbi:uncharacterized protein LOC119323929 [Triticum dicoccoides]|uniref:uncharacterized protein LOC119323929 n=1 Tax=Triticum dicoccoides TaxID=85692 RepID=UPI00189197EC|nr:uncharacterized protein LOC119323929 [Triticum dicoccoides]
MIRPPITPQRHQPILPSLPQPSNRCIRHGYACRLPDLVWMRAVAPPTPDLSLASSHLHLVRNRRRRAGCCSYGGHRLGEGRPVAVGSDPRRGGVSKAAEWRDSGLMDPTPDAASPCCPDLDDGEPRLPTGGGWRSRGEDGGAWSDPGGSGRDGYISGGFGLEAAGSGEIEGRWRHGPPGDPCSPRKRDRGERRSR